MQLAAARTSPAVVALPQNAAAPRCRCSGRPSTSHRRSVCTAAAAGQPSSSSSSHHSSTQDAIRETVISTRRSALLTAGLLCVAGNSQAATICADLDTAEAGDACRQALLAKDEKAEFKGDYKQLTSGPSRKVAGNVPVGDLNTEYARSTQDLADKINEYITIDVYDKKRQGLIKSLKADAVAWVSKYARGGSVRAQSARNMYIAADAVLGHMASNGLAPLPSSKAKVVQDTVATGLGFLAEGK